MADVAFPSLQAWFNEHWLDEPAKTTHENLLWREAAYQQIMFVRDSIHPLFVPGYAAREEQPIVVPNAHLSKSCPLPVYDLMVHHRIRITMSGNFYAWNISIDSGAERAVPDLFHDLIIDRTFVLNPVYNYGLPRELIYGSYADDPSRFTVQIEYSLHACWAFLFLVSRGCGFQRTKKGA